MEEEALGTTKPKAHGRALRALTTTLVLALLAALLLAGAALAAGHEGLGKSARPGRPTAKVPNGAIVTITPTFTWSKARGAAKYELRVYGGGKVAHIFQPGDPGYDANVQHGLIAAAGDQSTSSAWSNITSTSVGGVAQRTAIGTGQTNTTAIVAQVFDPGGLLEASCTSGAAYLCDHLVEGVYSDWYLPSKDELNQLYLNRVAIGGFESAYYWGSSEYDAGGARGQYFDDGQLGANFKYLSVRVRAIRSF